MLSNSKHYMSFEAPYDEKSDDVKSLCKEDLVNLKRDKHSMCGVFANAIYHAFQDNAIKYGYKRNYSDIQDDIRDKIESSAIPMADDFDVKVGQIPDDGGNCNLRNRDKRRIVFVKSQ